MCFGADGLQLEFSEDCPHRLIRKCLVDYLSKTLSLPLLLQVGGIAASLTGEL